MHYYQFNISDYRKDADWLSVSEAGIYRWLIDQYHLDEKPITNDIQLLVRRLHLTSDQKELLTVVLERFFYLDGNEWRHDRIDQEIAEYREKIEQAKRAGMASGKARRRKRTTVKRPLSARPTDAEPTINLLTNIKDRPVKKTGRSKFKYSYKDMHTAGVMLDSIKVINPSMKSPNLEDWANTIRLMREADGRDEKDIKLLFTWANQHDFWHKNILSPNKFRKQWDTLFVQRKADQNGGGRRLALPRSDDELAAFAAKHGLQKPISGDSFMAYRGKLNAELEKKDHNR